MIRLHPCIDLAHLGTCNLPDPLNTLLDDEALVSYKFVGVGMGWGWGIVLTLLRRGRDSAELYASQVLLAKDKPHIRHFMHLRCSRVHPLHGLTCSRIEMAVCIVHLYLQSFLPTRYCPNICTDQDRFAETW